MEILLDNPAIFDNNKGEDEVVVDADVGEVH